MVSTIESLNDQIDIKVYPNPFEDGIQINFNSTLKDKFTVSIYNQLGQVIYSETNDIFIGDNLIKLSDLNLNDGIYYLSINSESFRYTGKIVCVK